MSTPDALPVGTLAGRGRELGPFQGTPSQFPAGWVCPIGQILQAHEHSNPRYSGKPWQLPDKRREIFMGTSTHIESQGDDQGKMGKFLAANPSMPGEYPLIKVR